MIGKKSSMIKKPFLNNITIMEMMQWATPSTKSALTKGLTKGLRAKLKCIMNHHKKKEVSALRSLVLK